jgi:hypothetical protein
MLLSIQIDRSQLLFSNIELISRFLYRVVNIHYVNQTTVCMDKNDPVESPVQSNATGEFFMIY